MHLGHHSFVPRRSVLGFVFHSFNCKMGCKINCPLERVTLNLLVRNAVHRVRGKPCAQPERPACRPPPPCARGVPRACRARAAARDGLCRGSACNVRLSLVWIWVNLSGARPCAAALPRRALVLAAHFVLAAHSVLAAMCRELYHAPVQRRATACVAPSPRGCGLWLQCA